MTGILYHFIQGLKTVESRTQIPIKFQFFRQTEHLGAFK